MIVKIKNDYEKPTKNWIYCEGDVIVPTVEKSTREGLVSIYSNDTLFLLDTNCDESCKISYLHLSVYKNNQVIKRIVTDKRVYLMNNEGKTIDKLF